MSLASPDAALRRVVKGRAPLKLKLAALAQMENASATWLSELMTKEGVHPKLVAAAAMRLLELRRDRASAKADEEISRLLGESADSKDISPASEPEPEPAVEDTLDLASGPAQADASQAAEVPVPIARGVPNVSVVTETGATLNQAELRERGLQLAERILEQRARCVQAIRNREESERLAQLQREFVDWERTASAAGIDPRMVVGEWLDFLRPLPTPSPTDLLTPRRNHTLRWEDHLRFKLIPKEQAAVRKRKFAGLPSCGSELTD